MLFVQIKLSCQFHMVNLACVRVLLIGEKFTGGR